MAEEIGRRIAQELSDRFARIGMEIIAQQSSINFGAQTLASLRRSISGELRGFNEVAPKGFHLQMLSGQSCLVFTFETKLSLTLKIESKIVRLVPAAQRQQELPCDEVPGANGRDCCDFLVTRDDAGYHFQRLAQDPAAYNPLLSESDFIEGVLRVASRQTFDRVELHAG
jgi:hypothetical protein